MNAPVSAVRSHERWVGPLFGWELLRLSRGRGLAGMKIFIGFLLLVVLWSVWQQNFPVDTSKQTGILQTGRFTKELAVFAEMVVRIYLIAQLAFVLILTPILTASAVIDEKTRKTLEFLLATDLSRREILLGKFFARLAQMATLLLVGLPILAIVQLFGGIDIDAVIACHLLAFSAMFLLGAISLRYAVTATQLKSLLPRLWLLAAVPLGGALWYGYRQVWSNTGSMWDFGGFLGWLLPFVAGCLVLGVWFLRAAIGKLSRASIVFDPDRRAAKVVAPSEPRPRYFWESSPKLSGNALIWKESHFGGSHNRLVRFLATFPAWAWGALVMVASFVVWGELAAGGDTQMYNDLLRYSGMASLAFALMLVALTELHAASAITRDREQQTLIDLLMIPVSRGEILQAKWYGSLRRGRGVAWGLLPLLALSAISQAMGVLPVILLGCAAVIFCTAGIGFGLWLSVRHDSVPAASGRFLLVFIGWLAISWLVVESLKPPPPPPTPWGLPISRIEPDPLTTQIGPVVSPFHLWKSLCLSNSLPGERYESWQYGQVSTRFVRIEQWIAAHVGLMMWLFLGLLVYSAALRRLQQDGRF